MSLDHDINAVNITLRYIRLRISVLSSLVPGFNVSPTAKTDSHFKTDKNIRFSLIFWGHQSNIIFHSLFQGVDHFIINSKLYSLNKNWLSKAAASKDFSQDTSLPQVLEVPAISNIDRLIISFASWRTVIGISQRCTQNWTL